jgi:uncharacterized spore protein YtfJ
MDIQATLDGVRDSITVKRIYGEPYERNGVTVIPAATVGGGGGSGEDSEAKSAGSGGGFGIAGRPVGAYVISDGRVKWEPAIDVTRIATQAILALTTVAVLAWRRRS